MGHITWEFLILEQDLCKATRSLNFQMLLFCLVFHRTLEQANSFNHGFQAQFLPRPYLWSSYHINLDVSSTLGAQ